MANPTSRTRGTGSPTRRAMTATARPAATRAGRPARPDRPARPERGARQEERTRSGRTLVVEPPPNGWEDPPEPESFEEEPEDGAPPRKAGRSMLTAVLGLVLVAALVAAAVLGWHYL
ncbi:hypothetical protein [Streptomyces sp. NPDC058145]|uniref:hypothetical protein n=1 Tax=Streptomyces sp. NPDC058145 TaxID=3346356 RepID=UPI0036E3582A